ncbi:unnamed protein product [Calicophoron daubneyi]|uniref:Uncharacterized protein n=1 Tax=Calicophoron daubneyi TaxID=300641 RepID=A0AAV2T386_CALDB
MDATSLTSTQRSEIPGIAISTPIFLPGWWSGLESSQRWLLTAYNLLYTSGLIVLVLIIISDTYAENELQLVGLRVNEKIDQKVQYVLRIAALTGFWKRHARFTDTQKVETAEIKEILSCDLTSARELWDHCTDYAHRAIASRHSAFVLLTLGLMGLLSGYFICIFSRKWFIRTTMIGSVFVLAALFLLWAAALEYSICVVDRQTLITSDYRLTYVGYKGRFFRPTLRLFLLQSIGIGVVYVFLFLPMIIVGLVLLYVKDYNL